MVFLQSFKIEACENNLCIVTTSEVAEGITAICSGCVGQKGTQSGFFSSCNPFCTGPPPPMHDSRNLFIEGVHNWETVQVKMAAPWIREQTALLYGFKTLHKRFEHCRVKTNGLYFILNQKLSLNQGSCFWSVLSPGISSPSPPHLPKAVENSQYIIEVNTFRTIFLMIYVLYFASVLLERIAAFFFWAPGPVYS